MAKTINLDASQRVDIICKKGDTFNLQLTIKDDSGNPNVSGTYDMEVRPSDDDTGTPIITINGVTDAGEGTVSFTHSASNMATVASGLYVYDIENTDDSVVSTLIYGTFKVNEDVTT